MLKNDFIDGSADIILKNIDSKLLAVNVKYVNDFSLEHGLQGMYYYISMRVQYANQIPFTYEYMSEWNIIKDKAELHTDFDINSQLVDLANTKLELIGSGLGLCDGCSGYGLMLLMS